LACARITTKRSWPDSPRISDVHRSLAGELQLFVVALRPVWSPEEMVAHHETLRRDLQTEGPEAVRRHLTEGEHAVGAQLSSGA